MPTIAELKKELAKIGITKGLSRLTKAQLNEALWRQPDDDFDFKTDESKKTFLRQISRKDLLKVIGKIRIKNYSDLPHELLIDLIVKKYWEDFHTRWFESKDLPLPYKPYGVKPKPRKPRKSKAKKEEEKHDDASKKTQKPKAEKEEPKKVPKKKPKDEVKEKPERKEAKVEPEEEKKEEEKKPSKLTATEASHILQNLNKVPMFQIKTL
jgi:Mg-chelatase subunit ChlI